MKFEIKSWVAGGVLFSIETDSWKLAVEAAVKSGANLLYADLSSADLRYADLLSANLRYADLSYANLLSANLRYADLSSAKNAGLALAQTSIVPVDGPIYGWKKCRDGVLVKLAVGSKAKRSSAAGRKCRAEYVKVLEVIGATEGISEYDETTKYQVGKIVRCNAWDDNRWNECSRGIHFFLTKEEAQAWEG